MKLTNPKGANVLEPYNRVLFLQPLNRKAGKGLKLFAGKYIDRAKSRQKAGGHAKAEKFPAKAGKVRKSDERVLALKDELRKAKANPRSKAEQRRKAGELARAEAARRERERGAAERKRRETYRVMECSSDSRYGTGGGDLHGRAFAVRRSLLVSKRTR